MNVPSSARRVAPRVLVWLGVAALTYAAGLTVHAEIYQRYLSSRFDRHVATATSAHTPAARPDLSLGEGDLIGRLSVPRIGLSVMVLQGTDKDTLRIGAGHVVGTPLPGAKGNVAIAAHRDTFFRKLQRIQSGDDIQVATTHGTFTYKVTSTEVVDPKDMRVIASRARSELTLITCYPFVFVGAAPKRFIVHALAVK